MKTIVICLACALGILVVVLISLRGGGSAGEEMSAPAAHEVARSHKVHTMPLARRPRLPKPVLDSDTDDGEDEDEVRTPDEKALAARIEKALDDEDLKLAISCAAEAQSCPIAEIRQNMVDTLGWFGEKALPELTPFLADADEDVRESAMNEWTMALSSIEDEGVKIRTVELAMGVLKDEDALEEISSEYIGADEKLAVESLARIIDGGGSKEGIEKAKETYEFVTGDEWTDVAGAERWIAEEYEPPEEA